MFNSQNRYTNIEVEDREREILQATEVLNELCNNFSVSPFTHSQSQQSNPTLDENNENIKGAENNKSQTIYELPPKGKRIKHNS